MCYIFIGNEMIENLKGSSIFLLGSPNIIYQVKVIDEESNSSILSPEFRRMLDTFQNASVRYDSRNEISIYQKVDQSSQN